jgi:hypothetical protein
MQGMFYGAFAFNQDCRSWDVSSIIKKHHMIGAKSLWQLDFLPNAWHNNNDQEDLTTKKLCFYCDEKWLV